MAKAKKKHGLFWWLFISWWIWIFYLPIWIIKQCTKKKKTEVDVSVRDVEFDAIQSQLFAIDEKYRIVNGKHNELENKIGVAYTVVNNIGSLFSPEMEICIQLCKEDISLAPKIAEYYRETAAAYKTECHLPRYESFKRLAIIFEKRKQYDLAIDVCDQAISLGYLNDGSTGSMLGRKARLMKLLGKTRPQIDD